MRKIVRSIKNKLRNMFKGTAERRHALVGHPDLWQMKRAFQIDFMKSRGLIESHTLLDLGCGTLRGGIPLIEYLNVGNYFGLEVRPEVLEEARKELADAHLAHKHPTLLLLAESGQLPARHFNFIWAFSVLIHMDDESLQKAIALVSKALAENGAFYANVNIGSGKELEWQGFPVVRRPLEFYQKVASSHGLEIVDMGEIKSLGHVCGVESQDTQHMLRFTRAI